MIDITCFNWRSMLLKDRVLSSQARFLALYLSTFMNDHNDMAWPSLSRIQYDTKLTRNTVLKYLRELNDAGWLVTKRQAHQVQTSGGQQACNQYWITIPDRVVHDVNPLGKGGASDDTRGFISRQKGVHEMNPNNNSNNNINNNKSDSSNPLPHEDVINLYHEMLPSLRKVVLSRWKGSARAKDLTARIKEDERHKTLEFWRWFFESVKKNPHWMGENERGWTADLGWLLKRANFDKVIERGNNG